MPASKIRGVVYHLVVMCSAWDCGEVFKYQSDEAISQGQFFNHLKHKGWGYVEMEYQATLHGDRQDVAFVLCPQHATKVRGDIK